MSRLLKILAVLSCVLLTSCAVTRVSIDGDVNPAQRNREYRRLAVYANVEDQDARMAVEAAIAGALTDASLEAVPTRDILTDAKVYTEAETMNRLAESGFEAVVRVNILEHGVIEYSATVSAPDGAVVVIEPGSSTTHLVLQMALIDRETTQPAWTGQAHVRTRAPRDLGELAGSVANRLRRELRRQRVLR